MGFLSIFGGDIINKGMDLIDSFHTSDVEEGEIKTSLIKAKTQAKVDLMNSYAPFKIAQRVLAFMFASVFIFIMLAGVLGALLGKWSIENVNTAKQFAFDMWLGEIMITIISFYFGGGFLEGIVTKFKTKEKNV